MLDELDDASGSRAHARWFHGLVDSVKSSGDGKTPETAYVTISVTEEYAVLLSLGLRLLSQSVLTDSYIDAIEVEDGDGKCSTVYFNPEATFDAWSRKIEKARK